MKDLIERQAAIRWVKTECNPYGKPTLDFESGIRVIEHLEQMPSAQPDTPDTNGGDIIYRKAAIDALESIGSLDTEADKKYARSVFEALPSVQPETHDKHTETHACDCISRQGVLKILTDISYNHCPTAQASEAVDLAKTMVAVMPETNVHDLQKGADCISRQAAVDYVDDVPYIKDHPNIALLWKAWVEQLPSAQPETAKRIVGKSRDGMTLWYQCDMCNEPVDAQDNFCSGCGRRLVNE